MDDSKITLIDEDDNPVEFYVIEQTKIAGINYLLVAETLEDETEAYILKDCADSDSEDSLYEFIEDDSEIEYVGKIFAELLEDEDTDLV